MLYGIECRHWVCRMPTPTTRLFQKGNFSHQVLVKILLGQFSECPMQRHCSVIYSPRTACMGLLVIACASKIVAYVRKSANVLRRRELVIRRHQNDYFIGCINNQLSALEDDVRPSRTLDAAEAYVISLTRNWLRLQCLRRKKLANCMTTIGHNPFVDISQYRGGEDMEVGLG